MVVNVEWALTALSQRFATFVWVPGNHELWTPPDDPAQLRGKQRYWHLVQVCRRIGVLTRDDPHLRGGGKGGPVTVAPLFLLYDYSFRPAGTATNAEAIPRTIGASVVFTDEFLLHPDPYPNRDAWCHARVVETERRLAACDADILTILVNHFPLVREPTRVLRYPEFAQWCGTEWTADGHQRFQAGAVTYGHLHIPPTTWHDSVRFEEVSVGYPRERRGRPIALNVLRQVLQI